MDNERDAAVRRGTRIYGGLTANRRVGASANFGLAVGFN
jgi:hypothetical protein